MSWWIWMAIAGAGLLALYGVFRWASADPEIDAESARELFRAEQDWRATRRPDSDSPTAGGHKELKTRG